MLDFIETIYNNSMLLPLCKEIIEDSYSDRGTIIKEKWDALQSRLNSFLEYISLEQPDLACKLFNTLKDSCTHTTSDPQNICLFADGLQDAITLMYLGIAPLANIDVEEKNIHFHSSKSGFLNMTFSNGQTMHSNTDPMWEARKLAAEIFDGLHTSYKILGCGLGYLPYQIYSLSDCSSDIYIYHNNPKFIQYAFDFGVLSWIPENKLHIIINENTQSLISSFADTDSANSSKYYCLHDVLDFLPYREASIVNKFQAFARTAISCQSYKRINVGRNILNMTSIFTDFKPTNGKEWAVVMAGPSLDSCLNTIRSYKGSKNVICASTVLVKLLNSSITPDCVAVLDPYTRTYGHFNGLTDNSIPLFFSSIANWRFAEYYSGLKYIVPCLASEESVSYFDKQGIDSLFLGSTVATMCIQIAATLGAETIELFGLDLAYPNGKTHSTGTMDFDAIDTSEMPLVPCTNGKMVHTSEQFKIYISEIENIISLYPSIKFVNHSPNGAMFKGSIVYEG